MRNKPGRRRISSLLRCIDEMIGKWPAAMAQLDRRVAPFAEEVVSLLRRAAEEATIVNLPDWDQYRDEIVGGPGYRYRLGEAYNPHPSCIYDDQRYASLVFPIAPLTAEIDGRRFLLPEDLPDGHARVMFMDSSGEVRMKGQTLEVCRMACVIRVTRGTPIAVMNAEDIPESENEGVGMAFMCALRRVNREGWTPFFLMDNGQFYARIPGIDPKDYATSTATDINVTMEQIYSIGHGGCWLLRKAPKPNAKRDPRHVEWIARKAREPRLIVLRRSEFEAQVHREELRTGSPTTRAAHRRRAHWRRLTSERFTHKRGQEVHVRAHYVGPRELAYNGERYEVVLDA